MGRYLLDKPKDDLYQLAHSDSLWQQRIAIIATFYFIKRGQFEHTLNIAKLLLNHSHDLIHKAVGWMLREVGKKDQAQLENFLNKHYKTMPRTMLRYAIEKFPDDLRKYYLQAK
jgi:3-methyladenine DNA glycosylase AlkD